MNCSSILHCSIWCVFKKNMMYKKNIAIKTNITIIIYVLLSYDIVLKKCLVQLNRNHCLTPMMEPYPWDILLGPPGVRFSVRSPVRPRSWGFAYFKTDPYCFKGILILTSKSIFSWKQGVHYFRLLSKFTHNKENSLNSHFRMARGGLRILNGTPDGVVESQHSKWPGWQWWVQSPTRQWQGASLAPTLKGFWFASHLDTLEHDQDGTGTSTPQARGGFSKQGGQWRSAPWSVWTIH